MKILLVVKSKVMENLGVMYLAAVIKNAGHETKIVDIHGAHFDNENYIPDIIGFSIMTGDLEKFKKLKHWLTIRYATKKIKFIVGGPDPTFFPEGYDWADEICRGEGELWFCNYLHSIGEMDRTMQNPSINDIPWPDRTDFPNMKIRDFITSRGCPYSCTYCFNARWNRMFPEQKQVRVRNVDDVVAEIKSVNPEYVYFQDSCFGVNMEWFVDFAKRMREEIKKPYQCNFRPEQITERRAYWLKESGCIAVRMALETASVRLRKLVGRNSYNLSDIVYASTLLKEQNIMFMIQNIIGIPSATIEDDLETLRINIENQPTYSWVSIYQPYPGTVLGDQCKEMGWYKGDYSDITDSFFDTSFLEISPKHKEHLEILQKVWAMCVDYGYIPKVEELTYKALPKLIHTITRRNGDKKLYLGLL
jgi:radical SAM superfamily enzyme YgiQ (UPF0313 family)